MSPIRFALVLFSSLVFSQAAFAQTPAPAPSAPPQPHQPGRYQLVVVPGHPGSPFMVDTTSGCAWHLIQDERTKRSTFIEMDVENLHWSWGSGAQSMLAARVDGSNLPDEQKQALKQDIQKTGCGLSSVVLTPGTQSSTEPAKAPAADKPKKK